MKSAKGFDDVLMTWYRTVESKNSEHDEAIEQILQPNDKESSRHVNGSTHVSLTRPPFDAYRRNGYHLGELDLST